MRHDLDILQSLFLSTLVEWAVHSPTLQADMAHGDAFWEKFNNTLLNTSVPTQQLAQWIANHDITDTGHRVVHLSGLRDEYLAHLAIAYCAGISTPSAEQLLKAEYAPFIEEIAFQQDITKALLKAGREHLKNQLAAATEMEIADHEIAAAFGATTAARGHDELRDKLKQWQAEEQDTTPVSKKKGRKVIPLLFFRVAAAAAVLTGGVVFVNTFYDSGHHAWKFGASKKHDGQAVSPAGHMAADTTPSSADSTLTATHTHQLPTETLHLTPRNNVQESDTGYRQSEAARIPRIVLQGRVADKTTDEIIKDAVVIITDETGHEERIVSWNGTFQFVLSLHHDYTIHGNKDGYISARLSLSTKDVQRGDADDTINATLRMEQEDYQ